MSRQSALALIEKAADEVRKTLDLSLGSTELRMALRTAQQSLQDADLALAQTIDMETERLGGRFR